MTADARALGPILVTGASGFVGTAVCAELVRRGVRPRALVRDASRTPPSVDVVLGTLADRASLERACAGVTTVIHLAARVHVMRDGATDPAGEYRRANVDGTRVLIESAAATGVRRFLLASSVKVMGESNTAPWRETDPPRPCDPYGASKLEAEHVVRSVADSAGMHAPILRLPLAYGPGVRANMLRLVDLVARGVPLPVGAVRNSRSLVAVDNLAEAIITTLAAPRAGRETMFVSDGDDLSTPDLVRRIARALGVRARLVSVPPALFRVAGRIGDRVGGVFPFPITTGAVDRLLGSLTVNITRLRTVTGFVPPVAVDDALGQVAAWYRGRASERGRVEVVR